MNTTPKWVNYVLFASAVISLYLASTLIIFNLSKQHVDYNGGRVIKLLYEFNDVEKIAEQSKEASTFMSKKTKEYMSFGDHLRVVEVYFKYKYSPAKVKIVEESAGYVLYKIYGNENIDDKDLWIMRYSVDDEGLMFNIKEYRLINVYRSERGIW